MKIDFSQITTAKLVDGSVTTAKLNPDSVSTNYSIFNHSRNMDDILEEFKLELDKTEKTNNKNLDDLIEKYLEKEKE
jgi:hypothetical protein